MFHAEAIGGNSEEIARTSGSCHGELTHGRGALGLAYAKMMQIAILKIALSHAHALKIILLSCMDIECTYLAS